MELLNSIPEEFLSYFDIVELVKKSKRSSIFIIRKKENGERFILRVFEGSAEVYKKLIGISCRNLPKVFFSEEYDGTAVVLEEYVIGDTLYDILCGGVLSEKESEKIILQLCESLKKLHEIDIVHRDIKPENIIIRGDEAVLIDFDASRMVDPEKDTDTKILGTTGFAAPEQYGISQTDARADIYSLGVMLNVMLTGAHPSIKLASGSYGDIVQKCTMINPDKRYQSADEIVDSIEKRKKPIKKHVFKGIIAFSAALLLLFVFFYPFSGGKETGAQKEATENFSWKSAKGMSTVLPEDFYDYWKVEEFLSSEQLSLSFPMNMADYVSYCFDEDVLNIIINEVPDEEFEENEDYSIGDDLYITMEVKAPSEDIEWEVSQQGNGPTYSNMKNQISSGEELEFYTFSKGECITRKRSFAKVVSIGGKNKIAFYNSDQVFYLVIAWKDSEGNIETQILPYSIIIGDKAKKDLDNTEWIQEYFEPVTDSERIIFREVYDDHKFYTEEEMEEAGLILDVFYEPGVIAVNQAEVSKINIERIANAEAYLLPPDSTPKREEETYEEWLDRIYSETKYVGYKMTHSTGVSNTFEDAKLIEITCDGNPFFYVWEDYHTLATNIMETTVSEIDGTTVWATKDDTKNIVMTVDWYTEDINENPNAEPERREYLLTRVNPFVYYQSDDIIAGGYCGGKDNYTSVVWNLDKNGVLSISGKGPMADYFGGTFLQETKSWVIKAPWGEFADKCKTLEIGEGITSVGEKAFAGMTALSGKLVIPKSVTEIKNDAFLSCGFDSDLTIPGNVKSIGESAFSQWNSKNSGELIIEEGLEHLGSNAFLDTKFTVAYLPSTLRDMQGSVFNKCPLLEKVIIDENNKNLRIADDVIYTKDMKIIVEVLGKKTGKFEIPKGVETVGVGAFQMCNLDEVIVPESIKTIKRAAFHGFEGKVQIMGGIEKIEDYAFYPSEKEIISVYFHENPPINVYGAETENPSFCEYRGEIEIYRSEKYSSAWKADADGKWNGYEIFGFSE